jgi:hypothetical protein
MQSCHAEATLELFWWKASYSFELESARLVIQAISERLGEVRWMVTTLNLSSEIVPGVASALMTWARTCAFWVTPLLRDQVWCCFTTSFNAVVVPSSRRSET